MELCDKIGLAISNTRKLVHYTAYDHVYNSEYTTTYPLLVHYTAYDHVSNSEYTDYLYFICSLHSVWPCIWLNILTTYTVVRRFHISRRWRRLTTRTTYFKICAFKRTTQTRDTTDWTKDFSLSNLCLKTVRSPRKKKTLMIFVFIWYSLWISDQLC